MTNDESRRKRTDGALRTERDETDRKLVARGKRIAEDADDVIHRARTRADAVLATARARADERMTNDASRAADAVERRDADRVLAEERRAEDAQLDAERGARARALVDRLAHERELTDNRLYEEREFADAAIGSRDDFLAMVTHDLRALLNGVTLSAGELLAIRCEGNVREDVDREARRVQRFAARMNLWSAISSTW